MRKDQAIGIETALILYTKESAEMVGFDRLGQLKEGYKADFLILDRDILEIPPEEIDQVSVAETYINGRCVYRKKQIKYEGEKRMFTLPKYYEPDFSSEPLKNAPDAKWEEAAADGVAPENYHSTSMYPEYFKINGKWMLPEKSRMDSSVVYDKDGTLKVVENRNLKKGDRVILGRTEKGEEGIYLHTTGFENPEETQRISLCSVREEAGRLLMPETMTDFLNC